MPVIRSVVCHRSLPRDDAVTIDSSDLSIDEVVVTHPGFNYTTGSTYLKYSVLVEQQPGLAR